MIKKYTFSVLFFLAGLITLNGQTVNENVKLTWPFDLGTADQAATISPASAADYFSTNWTSIGSNLRFADYRTSNGITFTRVQPTVQNNSVTENDFVAFNFRTKTGLKFKPTSISFDSQRYGTDGGLIDVVWVAEDGGLTSLATEIKPARDNSGAATHTIIDLSTLTIPESGGDCILYIYIYSLGNTKQVGLANIVITGNIQGTIENVVTYTLTTSASPENAGTVTNFPIGTTFDSGTEIALTAQRNFGYQFKEWRNGDDDSVISTANPANITLTSDMNVKAVFEPINTYSLHVNIQGGAAPYMVEASPEGNVIDGITMYEEGTNVTLTASNNPILTFTNWLTGETNAVLPVVMNQNQEITAVYSAVDYVVGWDFYKHGNSNRPADFYSTSDNEISTLILRKEDGTTSGWLDKSQLASGGYEGAPAAVNWKPLTDKFYYQITLDATEFKNLVVKSSMLFNYNAYSIQNVEYSIDGTNFTKLGSLEMSSAKVWYPSEFSLPADADHAQKVYIRWIPDYTSAVVGSTSNNDGTAISAIYVLGSKQIINDGVAPVLTSSVPANNGVNASTTGKIVLNFDEKVQVAEGTKAVLGTNDLTPVVSGQTITFNYAGLDYNTTYTFSLPANTVSDLSGNTLTTPIEIVFNTMNRPTVIKKAFDFVVGKDGDFKAAIAAATAASSTGERFRIFFPDGEYDLGTNTGDANQKTVVSLPNISYIGQSADGVVLFNKPTQEGIGITATINFTSNASNIYMQDITLLNKMDYRTGTLSGRAIALQDQGNKNIYKNVNLLSNQDTYYSGNGKHYFEGGSIHGTVDFICGGGDIFFNEVLLYLEERAGNCITAPATSTEWGYVFNNCTIDGFTINNGAYRLGRSWQNAPKAVYLNTTMKVLPTAEAWGDPMNVVPALFAEYNSISVSGSLVDLSNRRTTYTKDDTNVTLNPVLTSAEAAQYTVENVLGGTDAWQPKLHTDQALVPTIAGNEKNITWENNDYVLCWAIFKDNIFQTFVTTNSYEIPADVESGIFTVRAANEMGGLSAYSNTYQYGQTGVNDIFDNAEIINQKYFTIDGKQITRINDFKGVVIVRSVFSDGKVKVDKIMRDK
jgi:pectin methylesterase-like acyl-CoA thioesterase